MSVAKLRFKEFKEEWEDKTFSQANIRVIDGDRGENYPNGSDFSDDGYCLFLNAKNVTKSGFAFNEVSFISKEKDEVLRKGKLIRNDLIITTRGTVGNIAYFDKSIKYENIRINSGMVIIRNDSSNINPNYLYKYFYSPRFRKTLEQIAFGSAQPQLTVAEINKFKISFPVFEEQTKIADFLMVVDKKIAQLMQKCELLARYKKGVMQQIFSQELRFKDDDGSDFPDWENTTIGAITDKIVAGGTPSTFKQEYWNGNIRWMNSGELNFKRVFDVENRITQLGLIESSTKLIPKKCIQIGLAGQGKTRGTIAMNMIELCINQSIAAVYPNPKVFDEEFLYHNLDFRYEELRGLSTGDGGRGGLNLQIIRSIDITLPTISEQIKISSFLNTFDEKITEAQTYLDTVKQYKQGLLQQMFV